MEATAAARLAASLRAVMKDQALRGPVLADRIERLTAKRPSLVWVSRRLSGRKRLITVDPDLFVIAQALEVDRGALIAIVTDALFGSPEHDQPCGYVPTKKGRALTLESGTEHRYSGGVQ